MQFNERSCTWIIFLPTNITILVQLRAAAGAAGQTMQGGAANADKTFAPRKRPVIRYSQRELANMVGGTRESVNRCLRNWQRNGIVQITEGSIIITNRPALEQMAEPT